MNEIATLLSLVTGGTFGLVITGAVTAVTAIAITRQWEKATILMLPLLIGFIGIGIGRNNSLIMTLLIIAIMMYVLGIFYENKLLAPKLASRGMGFMEVIAKRQNELVQTLQKRSEAKKDLINVLDKELTKKASK